MPGRHHDWSYGPTLDADWHGFEGFITTREEIDRVAGALRDVAET